MANDDDARQLKQALDELARVTEECLAEFDKFVTSLLADPIALRGIHITDYQIEWLREQSVLLNGSLN